MSTALWIVLIVVVVLLIIALLGGVRAHRARTHRHRRVEARARHAEARRLGEVAAQQHQRAQRASEVAQEEQHAVELHRQRALRARKEAEAGMPLPLKPPIAPTSTKTAPGDWTQTHDMAEFDLDTILSWRGRTVLDRKGEKLGKLEDLYLDEDTDQPSHAGVRTGLFGRHQSVVPSAGMHDQDGDLVVPHDAELVRDAPAIDPDTALNEDDAQRLASHYATSELTTSTAPTAGAQTEASAMTRSEEEVLTGTTEMRPAERVRLPKVLVTDHVKRTVPVRREEIRLDTDPPPQGHIESAEDVQ